jgi:hypothetical protein
MLLLAAVCTVSVLSGRTFQVIYAFIFILSLTALLFRALNRPEQKWYRCRAFAESVKTLTWRYLMHAPPFQDDTNARAEFRNHLNTLFRENGATAELIVSIASADEQITVGMDKARKMPFDARKAFYLEERVSEQRSWYARKAGSNQRASNTWLTIGAAAYLVALALVICQPVWPQWKFWPIEPIIVFASSIIGWTHIKKFSELAAAYTVTAHEIGLIQPTILDATDQQEFATAVNDAEQAFSREHTSWIARQTN